MAPPSTYNLADLWEAVVPHVADRTALVVDDRLVDLRRARGAVEPAGRPPAPGGHRARRPRRVLPLQRLRVRRGHARRVQAAGGADQRQLPLRRRRAALPVRRRRAEGARARPVLRRPGRRRRGRPPAPHHPPDGRRRRRLRGRAGVGVSRAAWPWSARATTTTSSTRAAPPACPRAWCGAWRTRSTPASAAATGCGCSPITSPGEITERIQPDQVVFFALAPMMHGAAQWTVFSMLLAGGKALLTASKPTTDYAQVWRLVTEHGATSLTIIGDAVARPLIDEYLAHQDRYDASSIFSFGSGAVAFSDAGKAELAALFPNAIVNDGYGASETGAQARSLGGGRFSGYDDETKVVDPTTLALVEPGSGGIGRVARRGPHPAGLLQRPGQDRRDVLDRRRRALGADRRRGHRARRRHHPALRPWLDVHQHRRREGLRRGGREHGGRRTRASTTCWSSGCPTRAGARRSWRCWRRCPARRRRREALDAHCRDAPGGLQGAARTGSSSTRCSGRRRARPTTRGPSRPPPARWMRQGPAFRDTLSGNEPPGDELRVEGVAVLEAGNLWELVVARAEATPDAVMAIDEDGRDADLRRVPRPRPSGAAAGLRRPGHRRGRRRVVAAADLARVARARRRARRASAPSRTRCCRSTASARSASSPGRPAPSC